MNSIEAMISQASELEKLQKQTQTDENQRIANLRHQIIEAIQNGQGTGEPIKDFVIVHYGLNFPHIEEAFRHLDQSLTGHVGELVMLKETKSVRHRFGGPGDISDRDFHSEDSLSVGVITGGLIFTERYEKCLWSTSGYVGFSPHSFNPEYKFQLEEGNLGETYMFHGIIIDPRKSDQHTPENRFPLAAFAFGNPISNMDYYIGDEAVHAYFTKYGREHLLDLLQIGRMLNFPIELAEITDKVEAERSKLLINTAGLVSIDDKTKRKIVQLINQGERIGLTREDVMDAIKDQLVLELKEMLL